MKQYDILKKRKTFFDKKPCYQAELSLANSKIEEEQETLK